MEPKRIEELKRTYKKKNEATRIEYEIGNNREETITNATNALWESYQRKENTYIEMYTPGIFIVNVKEKH